MTSGAGAVIELDSVAASVGGRTVWSGASLTLNAGALLTVLGPNGAGKSTLLRLLLGLLAPSAGRLRVLGSAPHRGHPDIGFVPQRRHLDAELPLRGADFVGLGQDGMRWGTALPASARRRRDLVAHALAAVDGSELGRRPVGQLSGGEQQRLFLAQALVSRPRLLLLDEPLASLDVRNQLAVVQLVADIARERGIAVVMVTHDINPVLPFTDQVMYIARGRVAVGLPAAIIRTEVLSDIYGAAVEVVRDSTGRLFVVGLEDETAHPHGEHA